MLEHINDIKWDNLKKVFCEVSGRGLGPEGNGHPMLRILSMIF